MTLSNCQIKKIVEGLTTDIDTYRAIMPDLKAMNNEDLVNIIAFMAGQLNGANQIIKSLSNEV